MNLALFYVWVAASVRTHWNHSFDIHLSYLGPASYYSPSCFPSGCAFWGGCNGWGLDGGHPVCSHPAFPQAHHWGQLWRLDMASQVVQWSRTHLPTEEMQETLIQSLGQEDALEEDMATFSSIPAWEIPWTEQPGGLQSMESQRVEHD